MLHFDFFILPLNNSFYYCESLVFLLSSLFFIRKLLQYKLYETAVDILYSTEKKYFEIGDWILIGRK